MLFQVPNDKWTLANRRESDKLVQYHFKSDSIVNTSGKITTPAILMSIEDTKRYKQGIKKFYKQEPLQEKRIKIEKTLVFSDKDYLLLYKNGIVTKASYIQEDGTGILVYIVLL